LQVALAGSKLIVQELLPPLLKAFTPQAVHRPLRTPNPAGLSSIRKSVRMKWFAMERLSREREESV